MNFVTANLSALASLLVLLSFIPTHAQEGNELRIAFYNVENLFHPDDDSLTRDEEFTPEGMRNWGFYRYREKSNRMAKAILSIGEWEPPAIVGLCEIENRQVVEDLAASDVLRKFNYKIIHFESPDRRGIDVGMMYRADFFAPLYSKNIAVLNPEDPDFATRDILYTKGVTIYGDTLHLFFNHWPSRYGGQAQSEPKRILAAGLLRKVTDSISGHAASSNIIIAGDFNDEWENASLRTGLGARKPGENDSTSHLVNLMAGLPANEGSHRYRGVWSYLDQIIVSDHLLKESSRLKVKAYGSIKHDFLLETDERYPGQVPFRTFIGLRYHGGFSDHLPVYLDLVSY